MVPEDIEQCARMLKRVCEIRPSRLLLLSPNIVQYRLFQAAFPSARIYTSDRLLWDLTRPKSWHFDLVFAGNVMHYSPSPALWYSNVIQCCRVFMVQDLINRRRSETWPYLAADGDMVRYQFTSKGVVSEFADAFDLERVGAPCLHFTTYSTSTRALHFIALFQGREAPESGGLYQNFHYFLARLATVLLRVRSTFKTDT
jgi:hypothetical protein